MLAPGIYCMKKLFFITREIEKVKALLASYRLITAQKQHKHNKLIWKLERERIWGTVISLVQPERKHQQHWEQSQQFHNHTASINNVQRVHEGLMEFIKLFTKSGGHCMSELDRYNNQDETDTRQILKYFISPSQNLPVDWVKILAGWPVNAPSFGVSKRLK